MKKIIPKAARKPTSAILVLSALAVTFWFVSSPLGLAQTTCTLCHKRTTTITPICGSTDYQRHIDHGDTIGPCNVTPVQNP